MPSSKGSKVFAEAMDRYDWQSLHQKLQGGKPKDIQKIFSKMKYRICKLMFHQSSSFVVQKLFEVCDEEQMDQLVFSVTADPALLMSACLDPQGAESMKKFLECIRASEQISQMIRFFSHFSVPLANDQFGSLVIGHCFHIFTAEETKPLLVAIDRNCSIIAVSESGSYLLRAIISKDRPLGFMLMWIMMDAYALSTEPFGNYVLRHVIGLEIPCLIEEIVANWSGVFHGLSMDKYGSKVVKKLMKASKRKYAPQIINDIISSPEFSTVLVDPFGYSVLQTAMQCSKGTVRKRLHDLIRQHSELLNRR
ncbi:pumilio homolog 12-like [Primulina eburnea]|uniref:pumilio homolog 12-like n=1 Tax=Primulina eburnea TaxID=1245227 RepID=UPI003C6CBD91